MADRGDRGGRRDDSRGDPGRLGYPAIGYGRGYGRDFGGGLGQGYEGSWGQGYGGSLAYSDYREDFLGAAAAVGPHGGKGPGGWARSDERLREQVSERLMEDRLLDARQIEVAAADGVVTLRGEAASPAERLLSERLARACGGVREVVNELEVGRPATQPARPPLGAQTGAVASPLREGERDAGGREEGPRGFPTLSM
jgi:hypothetical protein